MSQVDMGNLGLNQQTEATNDTYASWCRPNTKKWVIGVLKPFGSGLWYYVPILQPTCQRADITHKT